MFDKIVHEHKTETIVSPITKVIEKSITPDKVTEMYDKIEKEIGDRIVKRIIIKGLLVEGVIVIWQDASLKCHVVKTRYKINGNEFISEYTLDALESMQELDPRTLYHKFCENLAKDIAYTISESTQKTFHDTFNYI